MNEPLVEIVYSLTEEDLLHHVRLTMKSRFKDPLFRLRLAFVLGYVFSGAGVVVLGWLLATGHSLKPNEYSGLGFMVITCCLTGFRYQKQYREFYDKIQTTAKRTDLLVLRAGRNGFSITRPGVSESSINWTAIKGVNFTTSYLYIDTLDGQTYRVPSRFIAPEQKKALIGLLTELWEG